MPDISPEDLAEVDYYSSAIEQYMATTEPSAQLLQPTMLQDAYGVPAYPQEEIGTLGPLAEAFVPGTMPVTEPMATTLMNAVEHWNPVLPPNDPLRIPGIESSFFDDALAVPSDISPGTMTQDSFSPAGEVATPPESGLEEPFFNFDLFPWV